MFKNSPPSSPLRYGNGRTPSSYVPNPVYPWSSSEARTDFTMADTLSSSSYGGSKTSIADTISRKSTNFSGRLQDRLAASMAGLKELDSLRNKHRQLVQEVKNYVQFSPNYDSTNGKYEFRDQHQIRSPSPSPSAAEMSSNISHRSSLSMDSGCLSLASDATSFSHQHTLSTDSSAYFSQPPSRKNSYVPSPPSDDEGCYPDNFMPNLCQSYTSIAAALAHENGTSTIPKAMFGYRHRRGGLLHSRPKSLYSYPEENTVIVEIDNDKQPIVRPRISRASSIQCTSGVGFQHGNRQMSKDAVYRANRVYIKPPTIGSSMDDGLSSSVAGGFSSSMVGSLSSSPIDYSLQCAGRRSRPTSFAMPNNSMIRGSCSSSNVVVDDWRNAGRNQRTTNDTYNQHSNVFTWEQVKRLLDPAFDMRTLVRHHSTVSVNTNNRIEFLSNKLESTTASSSVATVTRFNGVDGSSTAPATRSASSTTSSQEHIVVSRSVSSQSSDSNKSRKKEKSWRESEHL